MIAADTLKARHADLYAALLGAPAKTDAVHDLYAVPWRADRHPSLAVRRSDGVWFDNARGESGDVLHAVARVRGLDIKRDFARVVEAAGALIGVQDAPQAPATVPEVAGPTHDALEALAARYGLTWQDYADHGCTVGFEWFGSIERKAWAVVYRLAGLDGKLRRKARSLERLDGGKRACAHPGGGSGFFPADQVEGAGVLVVTAGEEKALAAMRAGFRAVSYSCGESGLPGSAAAFLTAHGNADFIVAMDADEAGAKGADKAAQELAIAGGRVSVVQWGADLPAGHDLNDELTANGREALHLLLDSAAPRRRKGGVLQVVTHAEIVARPFRPVQWVVEGLLPPGLAVITAPPKVGKSFLAYAISHAVAEGGTIIGRKAPRPASVLYLDYQMSLDQLQARFKSAAFMASQRLGVVQPDFLLDTGGLARLSAHLAEAPEVRLIVVDVYQDAIASTPDLRGLNAYERDAAIGRRFKVWLQSHPDLALLFVHHSAKPTAQTDKGEVSDAGSGSRGFPSQCDAILTLLRVKKGSKRFDLWVQNRVAEEYCLQIEKRGARWELAPEQGDQEAPSGSTQKRILDAIRHAPATSADLAKLLSVDRSNVRSACLSLEADGWVVKDDNGKWAVQP